MKDPTVIQCLLEQMVSCVQPSSDDILMIDNWEKRIMANKNVILNKYGFEFYLQFAQTPT